MRIAVLSDIHDHIGQLRKALGIARDGGAETLLCCGDLCSPFIVRELAEGFTGPIHIVFGNNDGDLFRIGAVAARFEHLTLHGELAELTLDGQRFAVNHYPEIARPLAASGRYDVVCFGHDHTFEITRGEGALLINPGEIMGELTGRSTFVSYRTETGEATRHDL